MSSGVSGDTVMRGRGEAPVSGGERPPATGPLPLRERSERGGRRLGVLWDHELVDTEGLWPEQLGLDTCGECDVEETPNNE